MDSEFWLASSFSRSQLFEPNSNRFNTSNSSNSTHFNHQRKLQTEVLVLPPLILPKEHRRTSHHYMNSNWNFNNEFEKDFNYEDWFDDVTSPSWNFDADSKVDNYWNCDNTEGLGNNNLNDITGHSPDYSTLNEALGSFTSSITPSNSNILTFDDSNSVYGLPSSTNLNFQVSDSYDSIVLSPNTLQPAVEMDDLRQSTNLLLPLPSSNIYSSNSMYSNIPDTLASDRFPQLSQMSFDPPPFSSYSKNNRPYPPFQNTSNNRELIASYSNTLPSSLSQLLHELPPLEIQSPFFDSQISNYFGSEFNFDCEFSPLASTIAPFSPNEERNNLVEESLFNGDFNILGEESKGSSDIEGEVVDFIPEDIKMFGGYRVVEDVYDSEGNIVELKVSTETKSFNYNESSDTFICYRRNHLALTSSITFPQSTNKSVYLLLNPTTPESSTFKKLRKIKGLEVELSTSTPALNSRNKEKSNQTIDGARLIQFDKTRKVSSATEVEPIRFDLTSHGNNKVGASSDRAGTELYNIIDAEEENSTILKANWNRIQFTKATINNTNTNKNQGAQDYYRITVLLYAILESEEVDNDVEVEAKKVSERIRIGSCRGGKIIVRGRNPKDFEVKDKKMKKRKLQESVEEEDRGLGERSSKLDSEIVDSQVKEGGGSKTSKRTQNIVSNQSVGSSNSSRKIRKL